MARFEIDAVDADGALHTLYYDTTHLRLSTEPLPDDPRPAYSPFPQVTQAAPGRKSRNFRFLIIQFGTSCNYECGYCSQRYIAPDDAQDRTRGKALLEKLAALWDGGSDGLGGGTQVQLWGGEPFVYWKSLQPLVADLRARWPNLAIQMTSNGSLWNMEKAQWAIQWGVHLTMSHDGPSQGVRAPEDVLDNPVVRAAVDALMPYGLVSFNPIIYKQNQSRTAIFDYFAERFGADGFRLANSEFIRPYDEQGHEYTLNSVAEHLAYRQRFAEELMRAPEKLIRFKGIMEKMDGFNAALDDGEITAGLGAHCGMDSPHSLAVDLHGNVITCMNANANTPAMGGGTHKLGHLDDFDAVRLHTVKHWSERPLCSKCPVMPLCRGSCMFLDGDEFGATCESEFSDYLPLWATVIYNRTGLFPVYIRGDGLPPHRRDIWGEAGEATRHVMRKTIPIKGI